MWRYVLYMSVCCMFVCISARKVNTVAHISGIRDVLRHPVDVATILSSKGQRSSSRSKGRKVGGCSYIVLP